MHGIELLEDLCTVLLDVALLGADLLELLEELVSPFLGRPALVRQGDLLLHGSLHVPQKTERDTGKRRDMHTMRRAQ